MHDAGGEPAQPAMALALPLEVGRIPAVLGVNAHRYRGKRRDELAIDGRKIAGMHDRRPQPAQQAPQSQVRRRVLPRSFADPVHGDVRPPDALRERCRLRQAHDRVPKTIRR
jgi:hypothetical protein